MKESVRQYIQRWEKYQDEYNWCKWLEKDLNERFFDESEEENQIIESDISLSFFKISGDEKKKKTRPAFSCSFVCCPLPSSWSLNYCLLKRMFLTKGTARSGWR